jgi:diaminohydroxyphosphoribosylaminopyrimidine deaminase/5-amino-6-(5-phosphoribosylamino)uracil reductase
MEDPHPRVAGRGCEQLRGAGVEVSVGVLARQARELNPGFIYRMRLRRPFVRCKLAMSLDGRTAMASGESQWITGEAARLDVQRLRAQSSAIMTGVGTILADDPSLNVRFPGATVRQPWRVILDPDLEMPPEARTLSLDGTVLVFTALEDPTLRGRLEAAGAQIQCVARDAMGLDLHEVLAELARREINEVHLECGATLAGAMCRAGLVDELIIYMAPMLLGDGARPLVHLPGLSRMGERLELVITDLRAIGQDWRITARLASAPDLLESPGEGR